jgi:hypothetical protein
MCEAGRIKYHLRESLPRGECSILIAGFQAAGDSGQGAHLHHRRAVGTCQPRGTARLATRLPQAAAANLRRPWRGSGVGQLRGGYP